MKKKGEGGKPQGRLTHLVRERGGSKGVGGGTNNNTIKILLKLTYEPDESLQKKV